MAEENGTAEEQGGKSKTKMIIIIAVVLIVAIGASVGVTIFLVGGNADDNGDGAETSAEEQAEPVKQPAVYSEMSKPFVVTYNVGGRQRYLQIHMAVMGRDAAALDAMELHKPLIRGRLIQFFAAQDFEKLQTPEGKEALQADTLALINEILATEAEGTALEKVLFTNFVMQ